MRILVTGGAGFIASHITDAYISQGHEVFVIDNLSSGHQANVNPKAEFQQLDITSSKLKDAIAAIQPELINHHAAQINVRTSIKDPILDAHTNILGLLNLLESARACGSSQKFIFASTGGAIYGDNDQMPTPESFPAWPVSPYGIAKLTGEHYLHYYHQVHGMPFISLRYANVYGPRQNPHGEAGVVSIFYQKHFQNQPFQINGDGEQTRDFVYVGDVVEANLKASFSSETGLFNIGTATQTSLNQLIDLMKETLELDKQFDHATSQKGEQRHSSLDYSKAQSHLDWQPQTALKQGLSQTAQFFQQLYETPDHHSSV